MSQAVSSPAKSSAGLEGVVAAPSEICFIDGVAGRLVYRGYEIADLVENVTFEETAFLLWQNKLPNRSELSQLKSQFASCAALPAHTLAILKALPSSTEPMDALRTAASSLSSTDPDLQSNDPAANLRKAIRLTAQFPTIVAAFHRLRNGQRLIDPDSNLSSGRKFPLHADRRQAARNAQPRSGCRAGAACRARLQRQHICRPRDRRDAGRHARRRHRRRLGPQRPAPRRGQSGSHGTFCWNAATPKPPSSASAPCSPPEKKSPASATASTKLSIRAPPSFAR